MAEFTKEEGERIYQEEIDGHRAKLNDLKNRQESAFNMLDSLIEGGADKAEQDEFVKHMLIPSHEKMNKIMKMLQLMEQKNKKKKIDVA